MAINSKRKAPTIEPQAEDLDFIDISGITGLNSKYTRSDRMRRAKDALTISGWRMATLGMGVNGLLLLVVLVLSGLNRVTI